MTQRDGSAGPSSEIDELAALRSETDAYRFENLWSKGLEAARQTAERDSVLQTAGEHLGRFNGDAAEELSRSWLRQVAREAQSRAGEPLGSGLISQASKVLRAVFSLSEGDLSALHDARESGTDVFGFARNSPREAASVRDLGRIAGELRGTGSLAFIDETIVKEAVAFAEALRIPRSPAVPSVGEWLRVSRDDLLQWVDRGAASELPRLVRRLVSETAPGARFHFPSGTGVSAGGWDGVVECDEATSFVPLGRSVWELSTKKSSNKKAEDDYEKRTGDLTAEERAELTYVALICRPWTKAEQFVKTKSVLGDYRDVLAYNVDDIETWLEHAPATTVWLRELMGLPVDGVGTMASWRTQWLTSTRIPIDASMVLAGRDGEVEQLRERLQSPGIVTVGGEVHRDEILAFIGAAVSAKDSAEVGQAEVLMVEEPAVARRLFGSPGRLTIVASVLEIAQALPVGSRHRVIVPVPGSQQADINLPQVDGRAVSNRILELGEDFVTAEELGALARRSLLALRRRLATSPALYTPDWARGAIGPTLRRGLLLNRWNRTSEGDREIVARLFDQPYERVEEDLGHTDASIGDPPFAIVDEQWHAVSPADSWILVGPQMTSTDFERFRKIAVDVLTHVDPLETMSANERLRASLAGRRPMYSADLRHGIAATLAALGSFDPKFRGCPYSGAAFVEGVLHPIVTSANDDPSFRAWTALAPQLPLLAEAAPEVLLAGFRSGLSSRPPLLGGMFKDRGLTAFGSPEPSPHNDFLGALDVLAWSPEHLGAVVHILADLTTLDPGGQWAGRPRERLAGLMSPWLPHTSASIEDRLEVVNSLRRRSPDVAWELMESMLSSDHISPTVPSQPRYREWKHGEPRVSQGELFHAIRSVVRAMFEDAGTDTARWVALIERAGDLPLDTRTELIDALIDLEKELEDDEVRDELWASLRKLVALHREFPDANWALPESELNRLDPLVERFTPESVEARFGWLFKDSRIAVGECSPLDDLEEHGRIISARSADAVRKILETGGWHAAVVFAADVDRPDLVGVSLAEVAHSQFESQALELLAAADPKTIGLAYAYFNERFRTEGWDWLDAIIDSHDLEPRVVAELLCASSDAPRAWARADRLEEEVAAEYWARFSIFGLGPEFQSAGFAATRLQEAGRPGAALKLLQLYHNRHKDNVAFAKTVADVLEAGISGDFDDMRQVKQYEFEQLLELLSAHADDVGLDRVANIEWLHLPMLDYDRHTTVLDRALAENPDFFVQMIELVYRPSAGSAGAPLSETELAHAHNAYHLLRSRRWSPGIDGDGQVSGESLHDWVTRARVRLAEIDRVSVGETVIGEALAASPPDPDGAWPSQAVRELLEELRSDALDRGLQIGIRNSRGVTSRSVDAGGEQERQLAKQYREQGRPFGARWPRTAAIFVNVAQAYEYDAAKEDREAERWRRGLNG